jgi:hypothetical protein
MWQLIYGPATHFGAIKNSIRSDDNGSGGGGTFFVLFFRVS